MIKLGLLLSGLALPLLKKEGSQSNNFDFSEIKSTLRIFVIGQWNIVENGNLCQIISDFSNKFFSKDIIELSYESSWDCVGTLSLSLSSEDVIEILRKNEIEMEFEVHDTEELSFLTGKSYPSGYFTENRSEFLLGYKSGKDHGLLFSLEFI